MQLDVIERLLTLWCNPGEVVLTPFMGVGSEVYGALKLGRRAIGVELKPTYYRQAKQNIEQALKDWRDGAEQRGFDFTEQTPPAEALALDPESDAAEDEPVVVDANLGEIPQISG